MSFTARLEKPNFSGSPKRCSFERLPAFETRAALQAFMRANAPSVKTFEEFECVACGHWHAHTSAADPAGASSGQGRGSKFANWEEWRESQRKFIEAKGRRVR